MGSMCPFFLGLIVSAGLVSIIIRVQSMLWAVSADTPEFLFWVFLWMCMALSPPSVAWYFVARSCSRTSLRGRFILLV